MTHGAVAHNFPIQPGNGGLFLYTLGSVNYTVPRHDIIMENNTAVLSRYSYNIFKGLLCNYTLSTYSLLSPTWKYYRWHGSVRFPGLLVMVWSMHSLRFGKWGLWDNWLHRHHDGSVIAYHTWCNYRWESSLIVLEHCCDQLIIYCVVSCYGPASTPECHYTIGFTSEIRYGLHFRC